MAAVDALHLIVGLLGFCAVVQGFEFLLLARVTTSVGVWRWSELEPELGRAFRPLLNHKSFYILNVMRIVVGGWAIYAPNTVGVVILFTLHVLTLLRWLGTFNGGSDYMNLLLLLMASIAMLSSEKVGVACLWYICFQACLSYFKAGWFKLKNPSWRNGKALTEFLNSPIYEEKPVFIWLARTPWVATLLGWGVIVFETTFPLAIFRVEFAIVYLSLALFFHMANAYIFGLNRFVFAWLAAYPAILYCSLRMG